MILNGRKFFGSVTCEGALCGVLKHFSNLRGNVIPGFPEVAPHAGTQKKKKKWRDKSHAQALNKLNFQWTFNFNETFACWNQLSF